jgi:hypothetical protein
MSRPAVCLSNSDDAVTPPLRQARRRPSWIALLAGAAASIAANVAAAQPTFTERR